MQPYKWLAEYYDRIYSSSFRAPLDRARDHVLGPRLPRIRSACDLACGTGTTALLLAGRGIEVCGVDLSPAMCRLTRGKARDARLPLLVLQADMRAFELPHTVDLVLCEGDALNHIPEQTDLRPVAQSVARALRPGGYFYFDLNNRAGFTRYWGATHWIEAPGVAVVMHGGHDVQTDRAWTEVEWFIQNGTSWRRHHERVEEVCWDPDEVRDALGEAGFDRIRTWDAARFFGRNSIVTRGCRTVWLARKIGDLRRDL